MSAIGSDHDEVVEPPVPCIVDVYFWACVFDVLGSLGYVIADYRRGYLDGTSDAIQGFGSTQPIMTYQWR
jgi:hypothetical protein